METAIGYILGVLTSLLVFIYRQRHDRIRSVAEEYQRIRPEDSFADDTERLYAFQRAGVALLKNEKEIEAVCDLILHRGRKSPLEDWQIVRDYGTLRFFREANERRLALSEFANVIDVILKEELKQK